MSLAQTRLEKDFQQFHKKNPHVWELFKHYSLIAIKSGREHYSARAVIERIRWHSDSDTQADSFFKIPNATIAYYARLFHAAYPKHKGFYRTGVVATTPRPLQVEMVL